jgi:outer membrane cobalamin receptor
MVPFRTPPLARLALLTLLTGCGPHRSGKPLSIIQTKPGQQVITAEAIRESGANTAWDVIQRAAPNIQVRETKYGEPARMWRRGRSSILLNDAPLLFLDGVKVGDFRALDLIPAQTIDHIEILTGIEGTTYYGTNAVGGVILVHTKRSD